MPSVSDSIVINAPADATWAVVREFNGLADWHPAIAASEIEGGGPPNEVGAIRKLTTMDGGIIRETLLEHSDTDRYLKYDVIEAPTPVSDYIGEARVTPEAEDRSRLVMTSSFAVEPELEQEMVDLFGKTLIPGGLAAVKASVEK